jgi:hypothetical protein
VKGVGVMISWVIAVCMATPGCGDRIGAPSAERVPLGREFTLAVGQSAVVDDTGLRVSLKGVPQDSRCPVDVQCVWEGDATVSVAAAGAPSPGAQYELHTSGRLAREVRHGAHRISLVRLNPAPRSTGRPSPNDYRATLLVVR